MIKNLRRGKRKDKNFNPNRAYCLAAMNDYLSLGGRITRLKADDRKFEVFAPGNENEADEFLKGL